ncbi:MAG: hypothetical protein Tsb0020_40190 [Haliangiales bacterium]
MGRLGRTSSEALRASDEPEPEPDTVTVTIASPGTLWLDDLPPIEIRRGRSAGHYGYEVWFEIEGTRQVQFWRRTAIDLGDGNVVPAHAGRWGTFHGHKVYYPGAKDITQRVLELAIPAQGTPAQQQVLRKLMDYAQAHAVELKIIVYP